MAFGKMRARRVVRLAISLPAEENARQYREPAARWATMTYLLALVAALVGAALGFALGATVAGLLAPAFGITSFEGASGYFAVFIGGPIGGLTGLVLAPLLVLRRAQRRSAQPRAGAVGGRLVLVLAGVVGLAAAGLGAFWLMRPLVNPNGPAPQLVFEIRLPPGVAPPARGDDAVELQTSENRMPATLAAGRRDDGRDVVSGSVEIYYRTWRRMLVLRLPDKTDVLFDLSLDMTPEHTKSFTAWRRADYVARPGEETARRTTAAENYEIRYRVSWAGEE